jgi:hypothetical protein
MGHRSRPVEVPGELIPAAIRLLMRYGPTAVMRAEWRDPEDVRPNATRSAREIRAFRTFDPLRWSRRRHGDASSITELHIHAADRLRRASDMARIGGLPGPPWAGDAPHTRSDRFRPSSGLPVSAMAMSRADREYRRAMSILLPYEREVVIVIVLGNAPVTAWTRWRRSIGKSTSTQSETYVLVGALDKLVAHFDTEIHEDMALGRVEV